jgi:hypothetical protein
MIFDYDGLKLRPVFVMTRALIGCEHADGGGMQSCDDCELFEECPMLDMGENAPERCTTGRGSTGDPSRRDEKSKDHRRAWLDGLKPGDKVAYRSRNIDRIETVSHRTKTGEIVLLESGRRYKPNGNQRTASTWDRTSIDPVTPELLEAIAARKRVRAVDDVNWKMMPQEAVDAVYDLLMKRGDL